MELQRHKDSVMVPHMTETDQPLVFYRFHHPDLGAMTVRCTADQLIAAINEYLPSNPKRLARHFCEAAGPIGNLVFIASDLSEQEMDECNATMGRIIDSE